MRYLVGLLAVLLVAGVMSTTATATVLFEDDFSTVDTSAWSEVDVFFMHDWDPGDVTSTWCANFAFGVYGSVSSDGSDLITTAECTAAEGYGAAWGRGLVSKATYGLPSIGEGFYQVVVDCTGISMSGSGGYAAVALLYGNIDTNYQALFMDEDLTDTTRITITWDYNGDCEICVGDADPVSCTLSTQWGDFQIAIGAAVADGTVVATWDQCLVVDQYSVPDPLPLYGDANHDGVVDISDLTVLSANWEDASEYKTWEQGDFNGDQYVDISDLTTLSGHWTPGGSSYSEALASIGTVPEPTTFAMLIAGLVGLVAYAWRKR